MASRVSGMVRAVPFSFVKSDNLLGQVNLTSTQALDFTSPHAGPDRQPHHPIQHGIAGLIAGCNKDVLLIYTEPARGFEPRPADYKLPNNQ
jgi:hypothetical protein